MLTENDVVQAIARHLTHQGYLIEQVLSTTERGIDLIARRPDMSGRLYLEAKGATSARDGSNRFGKAFNRGQARSHIAVALYAAACMVQRYSTEHAEIAIGLPGDANNRDLIAAIRAPLGRLGVRVFLVNGDHQVEELA